MTAGELNRRLGRRCGPGAWRGSIAAGAGLFVLCAVSCWVQVAISGGRYTVLIENGFVRYVRWPGEHAAGCRTAKPGAAYAPVAKPGSVWPAVSWRTTSSRAPLWLGAALLGVAALPVRSWSRPRPGHCRCGYNLTGNTSGRCPECGVTLGPNDAPNAESLRDG